MFVPTGEHLTPNAERAQYELHENDLEDPRYQMFLNRLAEPVLARLPRAAGECHGLDVGCGPAPLLARMLGEQGVAMRPYDPFFWPDDSVWLARYDVITASEVVEHFRAPGPEFARLFAALAPGGILGVMTKRWRDRDAFAAWHYIRDPTHVAFYAGETFAWIAARHGATVEIIGPDVVVFTAPLHDNARTMPESDS